MQISNVRFPCTLHRARACVCIHILISVSNCMWFYWREYARSVRTYVIVTDKMQLTGRLSANCCSENRKTLLTGTEKIKKCVVERNWLKEVQVKFKWHYTIEIIYRDNLLWWAILYTRTCDIEKGKEVGGGGGGGWRGGEGGEWGGEEEERNKKK